MDFSFLSGVFASPLDIIRNIADVAIVAYLFYRILGLIKGTRAEQLLKGLVILLVFSVLATFLKLTMVNWLMGKLWIIFAITLPIVFQPELRRLLEQLGRGPFLSYSPISKEDDEYEEMISQLLEAVEWLSRSRVGALIVLPRHTGINEHLESGVVIDARVSSSLLVNLFIPKSPLHDGALIITNGRIDRAACFLPLSDSPSINKELGTRHRAALGITEISDAIVIVVSEETGVISLARDGNLQRYLNTLTLKEILDRELIKHHGWSEPWWRRWAHGYTKRED